MSLGRHSVATGTATFASAVVLTLLVLQACGSPGPADVPGDASPSATDSSPEDAAPVADGGMASDASEVGADATTGRGDAAAMDSGFDAFPTDTGVLDAPSGAIDGGPLDGPDDAAADAPLNASDAAPNVCGDGVRDPASEEC